MRHHHVRRGSSRTARKVFFTGGTFTSAGTILTAATTSTGNFWAKWPSGLVDTALAVPAVEPPDETVIATKCSLNMRVQTSPLAFGYVGFGLLAWDSVNPVDFQLTGGVYPSVGGEFYDWMWRDVIPITPGAANITYSIVVDSFTHSRAMRKMPQGTGVLAVVTYFIDAGLGASPAVTVDWGWDIRMACKRPL